MDKSEIIQRLERIAKHAVHTVGEDPFVMSLDDGIAVHETIDILRQTTECVDCKDDLISRQAALDMIGDMPGGDGAGDIGARLQWKWDTAVLQRIPSAQPQPEITCCKDCRYYSPINREAKTGICDLTMHQKSGDAFCSGAERKR